MRVNPASLLHVSVVKSLIIYKATKSGLKTPRNVVGADLFPSPPPARVDFPVLICFCFCLFLLEGFFFFFLLLSLFWKENNVQLLPPSLKNKFYLRTSWGMRNCMACLWQPSQGRRENQMSSKGKWFYSVDTIGSIIGYLVNLAIKYNYHFTDEEIEAQRKERRSWQFQSIKNPPKVTKVLLILALPFRVEDEEVRLLEVLIRIWDGRS